jgi:hypothetical protein
VWSLARLNGRLLKATGIAFSDDQLGRIWKQEAFSFQRPKRTLKGNRDEVAFQKAAAKLRAVKKNEPRWRRVRARLSG